MAGAARWVYTRTFQPMGRAIKAAYNDYKVVFTEMAHDARARPFAAATKATFFTGVVYAAMNRPDEHDFEGALLQAATTLDEVSSLVRNKRSEEHVTWLLNLHSQERLQFLNLATCTVVLRRPFSDHDKSFDATYEPFHRYVASMPERFVDIGYLGRWHYLEESMVDYDVRDD